MLKEFLTSIADKLRELLGTTDTINAQNFTIKIGDVYNAGYAKGKSEGGVQHSDYINPNWTDWRYFDYYGNRNSIVAKLKYSDTSNGTNFSYMFYYCSNLLTIPNIDTSNGTNFSYMFRNCRSLHTVQGLDTRNGADFSSMFYQCRALTSVPNIDTSNGTNFSYMFYDCTALTSVPKLNLSSIISSSNMNGMFISCKALENVTFEGTIKITANISVFSSCPNLTVDSLMSFINALSDNTGVATTYTVIIGSTNLAKLTQEQIDIATAKNITLA